MASVFSKLETAELLLDRGAELDADNDYVEDLPDLLKYSRNPEHNGRFEQIQQKWAKQKELESKTTPKTVATGMGSKHRTESLRMKTHYNLAASLSLPCLLGLVCLTNGHWCKRKLKGSPRKNRDT